MTSAHELSRPFEPPNHAYNAVERPPMVSCSQCPFLSTSLAPCSKIPSNAGFYWMHDFIPTVVKEYRKGIHQSPRAYDNDG
ncbi:hypothetical protein FA13DRAFT_1740146 [Coprinellus micaceus]|uniref:Uncharacterized protein n=1 Tax=Coprinellus micaceus TaxID=71717 RepID=A0A4Y7SNP2_COPMI|nr:hypothetical protein FA13DRAFT_1740146 [Coprinellus micaceus]